MPGGFPDRRPDKTTQPYESWRRIVFQQLAKDKYKYKYKYNRGFSVSNTNADSSHCSSLENVACRDSLSKSPPHLRVFWEFFSQLRGFFSVERWLSCAEEFWLHTARCAEDCTHGQACCTLYRIVMCHADKQQCAKKIHLAYWSGHCITGTLVLQRQTVSTAEVFVGGRHSLMPGDRHGGIRREAKIGQTNRQTDKNGTNRQEWDKQTWMGQTGETELFRKTSQK